MTDEFTFNARQYFDFSNNAEELNGDSFFEVAHEEELQINGVNQTIEEVVEFKEREMSDTESDSVFLSPMTASGGVSTSTMYLKSKLRRSLSMGNLPVGNKPEDLQHVVEGLSLDDHENERPSSSCSERIKKAPSQEHINRLAQPKRFTSLDNVTNMTLAEGVKKFQAATPKRFRSRPSPKMNKHFAMPWGGTKGHSPKLMTKQRARPNMAILSHEEREIKEMEEAKKFKIRAHPLNKKILRGPVKPHIEKRPPTQIEPFHITEVKKKQQVGSQPKVPVFKAQPLPKSLHKPFKPNGVDVKPATKPQTPNFSKRLNRSLPKIELKDNVEQKPSKPSKPSRTQPVPFSFEKRDQQIMKKKEELINKVLEEEKKGREFHAKPAPKAILRSRNQSLDRMSETSSVKSFKKSHEELIIPPFRARPASVLLMKPFEPKKEDHDLRVEPFQLTTEIRLEARHKFEEHMKEKEMMKEALKKAQEEALKKKEEEEVAKLRKQSEYKAQPIKKYKEIKIQPSGKITTPVSPVFHTDRLRNKENIEH